MNEHKVKIREFLNKYINNEDIEDDQDLFASGLVNSLFAMQLVLFLESEFGIAVENQDLNLDNFKSIQALSELIDRKLSSTDQSAN